MRDIETFLSQRIDTWPADRGLINFKNNCVLNCTLLIWHIVFLHVLVIAIELLYNKHC